MNNKEAINWAEDKLSNGGITDGGCTMSPDFNFKECCRRHDVMINYNQGISDRQAHRILRECITGKGHPIIAKIYWAWATFSSAIGGPLNSAAIVGFSILILGLYYFG